MQVNVAYREEQPVFGTKPKLFVDVSVQFSEQEKAIVTARSLENYSVDFDAAVAPLTSTGILGAGIGIGFAPILLIVALFAGMYNGTLGALIFFGTVGAFIWGKMSDRRGVKASVGQSIKVGTLLRKPNFTIFAADHAHARTIEQDIRLKLSMVKELISANVERVRDHSYQL